MGHVWKKRILGGQKQICAKCGMVKKGGSFEHPSIDAYSSPKTTPQCTGAWPNEWNSTLSDQLIYAPKACLGTQEFYRVAFVNPSIGDKQSFPRPMRLSEAQEQSHSMNAKYKNVIHFVEPYPIELLPSSAKELSHAAI